MKTLKQKIDEWIHNIRLTDKDLKLIPSGKVSNKILEDIYNYLEPAERNMLSDKFIFFHTDCTLGEVNQYLSRRYGFNEEDVRSRYKKSMSFIFSDNFIIHIKKFLEDNVS